MKAKKCKICKKVYDPVRELQLVCSAKCGYKYVNKQKLKAWKKRKKELKKDLQTVQELMKIAQVVFNKYVRLRDKAKGCISCNDKLDTKYDAGHYYSAGGHYAIRYHLDNCHAQCVACNKWKHGNLQQYRIGLIARIGIDRVKTLDELANKERRFTREELRKIIAIYKEKLKSTD